MQACFSFSHASRIWLFESKCWPNLVQDPLISAELDSLAKIHDCDIDYLYSNILHVKYLSLVPLKIFSDTKHDGRNKQMERCSFLVRDYQLFSI
jgi:hypothetical protein